MAKNTTSSSWSQAPVNITLAGKVTPGTFSIGAMVDTSSAGLNGIRVFYGMRSL